MHWLYILDRHLFIFPRDVKFFESIFPFKDSVTKKAGVNTVDFPSSNSGNDAQSSDDIFAAQDEQVTTLEDNIFSEISMDQNPGTSTQGTYILSRSSRQTVFPRNYNDFVIDSKVKTDAMNNEMDTLLRNDTWKITELPKDKKAIDSVMSSDSTSSEAPPSPDYVPGPEYLWYLAPANDEIVAEDQPYADDASPIALSPGYVADSNPKEDPEEDSKDGPGDYPPDGGDDDDDDDSSDDDEEEEASEEEEEEHLAPADSFVAPAVDPVPSSKDTEQFEGLKGRQKTPPPPPAGHTTPLGARISIRPQAPMPFPIEVEVERLIALPTPPPSPLISLSPPSPEERLARCLAAHARRARKTVRLEPPMSPSIKARIAEYAASPTPPSPPPSLLSPWSSPLP
ncbi:hypothetical protein Tco_0780175 [Tanacetum coccineum]